MNVIFKWTTRLWRDDGRVGKDMLFLHKMKLSIIDVRYSLFTVELQCKSVKSVKE